MKCDDTRFSLSELNPIEKDNSRIYIKKPRENSVISSTKSYFELNLDVVHAATNKSSADETDTKLGNLGPIVLSSDYNLTTVAEKEEDINQATLCV